MFSPNSSAYLSSKAFWTPETDVTYMSIIDLNHNKIHHIITTSISPNILTGTKIRSTLRFANEILQHLKISHTLTI